MFVKHHSVYQLEYFCQIHAKNKRVYVGFDSETYHTKMIVPL